MVVVCVNSVNCQLSAVNKLLLSSVASVASWPLPSCPALRQYYRNRVTCYLLCNLSYYNPLERLQEELVVLCLGVYV